jgi:hypothetical protein
MSISHWGFFPGYYGMKEYGVDGQCLVEDQTMWEPCSFEAFCEHADFLETLRKYPQ